MPSETLDLHQQDESRNLESDRAKETGASATSTTSTTNATTTVVSLVLHKKGRKGRKGRKSRKARGMGRGISLAVKQKNGM